MPLQYYSPMNDDWIFWKPFQNISIASYPRTLYNHKNSALFFFLFYEDNDTGMRAYSNYVTVSWCAAPV